MITKGYDKTGKVYDIKTFRSSPDAHQREYFDDCGIPITPCISDKRSSHFRYLTERIMPNGGAGMSAEHRITQLRFKKIFEAKETFWVGYYRRDGNNLKYTELDLKKYYTYAELEGKEGNRHGDILLKPISSNVPPILIEVWYKHQCKQEKLNEGHLIIEFRIRSFEDIPVFVRNWGLKESYLKERVPAVRFHNFRERAAELPWLK